jgi:hypothetical protein
MLDADAIATAKCFLISAAVAARDIGVPVFVAIVYIGTAMVSIIFAGTFNAIAEAATLNLLLKLRRRGFPGLLRAISISWRRRRSLCSERPG